MLLFDTFRDGICSYDYLTLLEKVFVILIIWHFIKGIRSCDYLTI